MINNQYPVVEAAIARVIDFAQRSAWIVILASFVAAAATAVYTLKHIAINTNTEDMLSAKLPWRVTYSAYKQDFPFFSDNIVMVIDGKTADVARDAAAELATRLRAKDMPIHDVFFPSNDEFLRSHQFLYLDTDTLDSLTNDLSEAQPFLARLSAERTVESLFALIEDAVGSHANQANIAVAPAITRIANAVNDLRHGDYVPMSWQGLILGAESAAEDTPIHRQFIIVSPKMDFTALLPAETAIEAIRGAITELKLGPAQGAEFRLSGEAALAFDELHSVITGSQNAGTLALVMILVCLMLGLRSLSLVVATLTSLIVGLIFTAGFAVACVGTLNMISVAFAVLYVGLGVDFAIHICLRYRELLRHSEAHIAVNNAVRHVGMSLILCAITTAIGFFAFIPTAYRGVAELGLIAGVGMFISLIVSVLLLPALLHVLPAPRSAKTIALLPDALASFPRQYARGVLGVAAAVWILAALCIPGVRFDFDPINLNNQQAESVKTYHELLNDAEQSPLPISVVVGSQDLATEYATALTKLPEVASVRWLMNFVPENQDEKLAMIDDLALIMGTDLEVQAPPAVSAARVLSSIAALRQALEPTLASENEAATAIAARQLDDALAHFLGSLKTLPESEQKLAVAALDRKLLDSFSARVALLRDGLSPRAIDQSVLPENIRQRWRSGQTRYRLEVFAAGDLNKRGELKRFVAAVKSIVGDSATGTPVINLGASDAVTGAFRQAFCYAFVVICGLLWFILRSFKETVIVLVPLILAGLITTAFSAVFSFPFNFANIIALPLLLGIGVDSALHILHRYKTALPENGNLLQTSTARGVFFSALTTIVSFGNLATSSHAGTASMGVMLSIGVISTLVCTLIVLPAMLKQFMQPKLL